MRARQDFRIPVDRGGWSDMPPSPATRGPGDLEAWTQAFYRRRLDRYAARTDAALAASRLTLAGARLRSLPSAGLGVLAAILFGAWLDKGG